MKRARRLVVLAGGCHIALGIAFWGAGCSDSTGDDPTTRVPEAATTETGPGQPPADGAADVIVDAGPPPPATVKVTHDGLPAPNVRVLFLGAADEVLASAMTSTQGSATAGVPVGGKVVAISDLSRQVYAWLGVKAGDVLALEIAKADAGAETVVVPSNAGANSYTIDSRCAWHSSAQTSPTVELRPGCTTADVFVRWNSNNIPGGSFVALGQTFTAGGTLDLSARTYLPLVTRSAAVTNVPKTLGDFNVSGRLVVNGHVTENVFGQDLSTSDGGLITTSGPVDDFAAAKLLTSFETEEGAATRKVMSLGAQNQPAVDIGAALLPLVLPATYTSATRTLAWTQGAGAAAPSAVIVQFSSRVTREGGFVDANWVVVSPPSVSITLPALPADLSDYVADGPLGFGRIVVVKSAAGPDAIRSGALTITSPTGLLKADGVLSVSERTIGAQ